MWNINPKLMCQHHLLGEHLEMHMFAGCLVLGKNLDGYKSKGLVDLSLVRKRHSELVDEMIARGIHHYSLLPEFVVPDLTGSVDSKNSLDELRTRCQTCEQRQINVSTPYDKGFINGVS